MSTDAPLMPVPTIEAGKPWPEELWPDITHLVTEDDTPVESIFHERQRQLLVDSLYASWPLRSHRPFVAMADVGFFVSVEEPPLVPDALVSFDVELPPDSIGKHRNSYFLWVYGKPPDVVVEVVSKTPNGEDTTKLVGYAQRGVPFYVIYDPLLRLSDDELRVYCLKDGKYELSDSKRMSEALGLGVVLREGVYHQKPSLWLRWIDASGELLETASERAEIERCRVAIHLDRADAERVRADEAVERADEAEARAMEAEERAARLALRLRELGIDPESLQ